MLECVKEHLEQWREDSSPQQARGDPDEPSGKTIVEDGSHTYQECPRVGASKDGGETRASSRDTTPGVLGGEQVESRSTEVDRSDQNDVEGARHNRARRICERNERAELR